MDQRDLDLLRCWTAGVPARPDSRPAPGHFTTIRTVPPARTSRPARSSHVGRRRSAWLALARAVETSAGTPDRRSMRHRRAGGRAGVGRDQARGPDGADDEDGSENGMGVVA